MYDTKHRHYKAQFHKAENYNSLLHNLVTCIIKDKRTKIIMLKRASSKNVTPILITERIQQGDQAINEILFLYIRDIYRD